MRLQPPLIVCTLALALLSSTAAAADHPLAFWKAIAQNQNTPPDGADVPALSRELVELLASPDPVLRDELAYSVLTAWIYQKRIIEPDTIRVLMDQMLTNLLQGSDRDTDGVFRRSFSALMLSVVVARDNAAPFLNERELQRIEGSALRYLESERDVRGYDPVKGWMHSAAHTADLLKFVGRSRYVKPADQTMLLEGIGRKVTTTPVFTHGEDERFARAVLALVNRPDFDRDAFRTWVTTIKPARLETSLPTREQLDTAQNVKNLFAKLEVLLSLDAQASESVVAARDALRAVLKDMY
jgi:hypothetical protein